ncbi:M43 family zinc metalloprotease [Ferruginibacter albus]|uniref:M43 family zinc metalloprotease n=1 Tax=Ferruginibacter albus TaxID=2875540 RepID=UPI001CC793C3|nr:M43 family zinc metalloprotease [Ferruginibacter albus]UAY51111.1 T9SS type A sorting domain-containing protein [Ferruginibacter albus]
MKSFFGTIALLGCLLTAQAQRVCGTVEYIQQLIAADPSLQSSINKIQQQATTLAFRPTGTAVNDTIPNQIINIPVVIHVLYNTDQQNISDAQVLSQMTVLNKDYRRQNADAALTPAAFRAVAADAKINFCLAQVDPKGRKTSGIIRKFTSTQLFTTDDAVKYAAQGGDDAWDCTKYLNIWVCNLVSRSLGYATPPGGPADRDGVVIAYNVFGTTGVLRVPFNKGRTATHEIGHWLGLRHIWGDDECGNDSIPDTPQQETYNYGCPSFPHMSSCSPNANGDMFMNFMDFSDDACMNMFTIGQVKVMRALFSKNGVRNSFLTSFQCDSSLASPQGGALPTVPAETTVDTVIAQIIKVYPNPVHSQLFITSSTISKVNTQTLRIYNTVGTEVLSTTLSQTTTTLNVSNLAGGVYIVRVGSGKDVYTTKVIKE